MTAAAVLPSPIGSPQLHRLAAPALLGVYGLVRLIPGSRQPGLGWTAGHLALLAGLLLFGGLLHVLHRTARERGPVAALLGYGTALVGLCCSLGQIGIDLYTGVVCGTRAEQDHLFAQIQGHPGVLPAFYQVGPLLFYVGLLALLTTLAVRRRLPWWSPVAMVAGTVLMAASLDLMTLGAALYALALLPLARPSR
jgi:hypothetical protein